MQAQSTFAESPVFKLDDIAFQDNLKLVNSYHLGNAVAVQEKVQRLAYVVPYLTLLSHMHVHAHQVVQETLKTPRTVESITKSLKEMEAAAVSRGALALGLAIAETLQTAIVAEVVERELNEREKSTKASTRKRSSKRVDKKTPKRTTGKKKK